MSEVGGLVLLAAGVAALAATGALAACCLRVRSPLDFVLAAYVVGWAWLVAIVLALSPPELVTRGWLLTALGVGLAAAGAAWLFAERPSPPSFRPSLRAVRRALGRPALAVLAVAVALGAVYTAALALFTPVNEGDSLAYHMARAAFWKQEQAVGYIANAVDLRLDVSPPNAEIGQLATMLLAGNDRYVALPQLTAYAGLVLCVAALARRLGLTVPEALFGALAFATLPVVAVQASGALNDLVVASFLAIAVLFALTPGRGPLVLMALALGLALGTKFTALLALPALLLVVALGRPRAHWPGLLLAGGAGAALGSVWYVLNLAERGDLDGGLAAEADQRVDLSDPQLAVNAMRYGLDLVDMSGLGSPYRLLLFPAALVIALLPLARPRSLRRTATLLAAAVLTLSPLALPAVARALEEATIRTWAALERPETAPFEHGWGLNVLASSMDSWFGPLGLLLVVVGPLAVALHRRHLPGPTVALALAAAPWVLLATLVLTIAWDPFRGRFLVLGVALAAATWGVLLRSAPVAWATASIGTVTLALSLATYEGKASGLADVWSPDDGRSPVRLDSVWREPRSSVQARLRPSDGEEAVYAYLDDAVPADARLAVAPRENDFLSPYFGASLSREVWLVLEGGIVPAEADWLVTSPTTDVRRCDAAWTRTLELGTGWHVERRVGPDACLS